MHCSNVYFWEDQWVGAKPFQELFPCLYHTLSKEVAFCGFYYFDHNSSSLLLGFNYCLSNKEALQVVDLLSILHSISRCFEGEETLGFGPLIPLGISLVVILLPIVYPFSIPNCLYFLFHQVG